VYIWIINKALPYYKIKYLKYVKSNILYVLYIWIINKVFPYYKIKYLKYVKFIILYVLYIWIINKVLPYYKIHIVICSLYKVYRYIVALYFEDM